MAVPDTDEDGFLQVTLVPISEGGAEDDLVGAVLGDRYELVELLGSGGAGEVYKAKTRAPGPPVAIKVMRSNVAALPEYVRRFRREARAASLLAHPNAVRVLELAEWPEKRTFFIVMELLEGESLGAYLRRRTDPPPLAEVASVLAPVLDVLEAAHARGIVHRDLKPENIFLAKRPEGRTVKVVDFGLARVADPEDGGSTLTKPDSFGGTPEYMSPEQCRSLRVGPSTDVYALGCILTELLTLKTPFEGGAQLDVLAKQMFLPPPPLARPAGAEPVPDGLEKLRLDMLAKEPEKRPADIAEVRRRLEGALRTAPVPVPTVPPPEGNEPRKRATLGERVRGFFRKR